MPTRPTTLMEHAIAQLRQRPEDATALPRLLQVIGVAAKTLSTEVARAGLGSNLGQTGRTNVQGEEVQRLDEFANETLVRMLTESGLVCAIGSEELAVPIRLPSDAEPADYAVVFDPLDGSSNIDVAVSIGTIFGIYRRVTARGGLGGLADLLQPAERLVAAGYALYGSSTVLVYSCGKTVDGFTLDPAIGEFRLSHPKIKLPEQGKIVSVNTANRLQWTAGDRAAVAEFEMPPSGDAPYSLRYVGSLVADAHRTLLKGGLFAYPADRKNSKGKLRLVYEAGPLAFLFERAGGSAVDAEQPITRRVPHALHDRTPLTIGSRRDVARYQQARVASSAARK